MAELVHTINVTENLRPVKIKESTKYGLFHTWYNIKEGEKSITRAIIELKDGEIVYVAPHEVQFLDNIFEEYYFEEREINDNSNIND